METIMNSTRSCKPVSNPRAKLDVLLIDNDLTSYYLVFELFSDYHINVIHARCGYERIFLLKNKEIALVISEFKLPRLDGFEVLRQIRKKTLKCQFGLTAIVVNSMRETCLSAGFNEFIEIPVDFKKFNYCVQQYLCIQEPTIM